MARLHISGVNYLPRKLRSLAGPAFSRGLSYLASALVGAFLGQIAHPALSPRLELYAYDWLGLQINNPLYLVITSQSTVSAQATTSNDQIGVYRIFCGVSSKDLRFCVMRMVRTDGVRVVTGRSAMSLDGLPLAGPNFDVIY